MNEFDEFIGPDVIARAVRAQHAQKIQVERCVESKTDVKSR